MSKCIWKKNEFMSDLGADGNGEVFHPDCVDFMYMCGEKHTLKMRGFNYCPYCGKVIEEGIREDGE